MICRRKILLVLLLAVCSNCVVAQTGIKTRHKAKKQTVTETPCIDALSLFTAANVPGKGLAQHPMLYVGENCNRMFLVKDGKIIWTYNTGKGPEFDDVWMLSNGNILFSRMKYIEEITPDKKVIWKYDFNTAKGIEHTEAHTVQPIGLDRVMFVSNGLPPKLMIVNIKTGN